MPSRVSASLPDVFVRGATNVAAIAALLLGVCTAPVAGALTITKSVTPQTASTNDTVEFTVTVTNDQSADALAVEVTDQLPTGLSIPAGMAAFVSQGAYDPASGIWTLGDLAPAAEATLAVPAQVTAGPMPACIINQATIEPNASDPNRGATAAAAVRRPDVAACVDLVISDTIFTVPEPFCSDTTAASLSFSLRNRGTDPSGDVMVSVTEQAAPLPGLSFTTLSCTGTAAQGCNAGTLQPGAIRLFSLVSDEFRNNAAYDIVLTIAADSADVDLNPTDNMVALNRVVPVTRVSECPIPNPLGGDIGGGCFIATAAWGTAMHGDVELLQRFRDRVLLHNAPGRAFVSWYYRNSPPVAAYIADKPALRAVTRAALKPLVLAIRYPLPSALFWLLLLTLCCRLYRLHIRPVCNTN